MSAFVTAIGTLSDIERDNFGGFDSAKARLRVSRQTKKGVYFTEFAVSAYGQVKEEILRMKEGTRAVISGEFYQVSYQKNGEWKSLNKLDAKSVQKACECSEKYEESYQEKAENDTLFAPKNYSKTVFTYSDSDDDSDIPF